MNVLVDTSVWSLLLRHKPTAQNEHQSQKLKTVVAELIHAQQVRLIGNIRQELLSGIIHPAQFDKLETTLSAFADETVESTRLYQHQRPASECLYTRCRGDKLAKGFLQQKSHPLPME